MIWFILSTQLITLKLLKYIMFKTHLIGLRKRGAQKTFFSFSQALNFLCCGSI